MELNTRQHRLEPGLLLISKPELGDPRFLTSVSLLCLHDEEGSLGLILNHPLPIFLDLEDFSIHEEPGENGERYPLFRGGPVGLEQCMAILRHEGAGKIDGAIQVMDDVYLGTTQEVIYGWREGGMLGRDNCKFFLGYAGWSYFQLDCEASNEWWFSHPARSETAFLEPKEGLWLNQLQILGDDFYEAGKAFIESDQI